METPVRDGPPPIPEPPPAPPAPEPPAEPPPPDIQDSPEFFGEAVGQSFVLVIDRSGSMNALVSGGQPFEDENGDVMANPSRLDAVRVEAAGVIRDLAGGDRFAIVSFGASPTPEFYEKLLEATEANKKRGIDQLKSLMPGGGTPAYEALQKACSQYDPELNRFFFLCDGHPKKALKILAEFPEWFKPLKEKGCTFIAVLIGGSSDASDFMSKLAKSVDGKMITRFS